MLEAEEDGFDFVRAGEQVGGGGGQLPAEPATDGERLGGGLPHGWRMSSAPVHTDVCVMINGCAENREAVDRVVHGGEGARGPSSRGDFDH